MSQVELSLSDENLAQDAFLLKHVQKKKMGFARIRLLPSFQKVGSPLRWPSGVGGGLPVEDAWVSGCALAVCGEAYGEVQALLRLPVSLQSKAKQSKAKGWWCRAGPCSLPSTRCSSTPAREGGWGSGEES